MQIACIGRHEHIELDEGRTDIARNACTSCMHSIQCWTKSETCLVLVLTPDSVWKRLDVCVRMAACSLTAASHLG